MKNQLIKYISILLFIIVGCVLIAKTMTGSQTVAQYAASHPSVVTPTVAVEIEAIPAVTDEEKDIQQSGQDATDVIQQSGQDTTDAIQQDGKEADADGVETVSVENSFYIETISDELKEYMAGKSYADNIDESIMNYDMLRLVVICYNDLEGNTARGEIVCNEMIAQDLLEIFEELYYAGYQFEEVALIDKYDADDDASMEANNTSCFNYRVVDNTTKLSYHAYGLAIDINPFYNPYVQFRNGEDYICPTASAPYADRSMDFPYKIDENDLCYKLFKEHGFSWGGAWNSCKDYQHFEKRLR